VHKAGSPEDLIQLYDWQPGHLTKLQGERRLARGSRANDNDSSHNASPDL
jgi:hypothetical protein